MATTILLARHGQTDWNLERRVQGHTDRALDETGRAQARTLADELEDEQLDAIYSSDLIRALDTARHVADRRGLSVMALPDLREKHFGTWEGLTDAEVIERFPSARNDPWGDGETGESVERRVLRALRRIADAHPNGRVLVVSHGGPLRAVLRHCRVAHERIANCHVVTLEIEAGSVRAVD